MTVYSGTLHQSFAQRKLAKTKKASAQPLSPVALLNLGIIGVIVVVFTANLFISNSIASHRFSIRSKLTQLHTLNTNVASQESELTRGQDLANLVSLAQRNGMVAGKGNDTLFATSNVALSNAQATKE